MQNDLSMLVWTDWLYKRYSRNIHAWYMWLYTCPIKNLNMQVNITGIDGLEYYLHIHEISLYVYLFIYLQI